MNIHNKSFLIFGPNLLFILIFLPSGVIGGTTTIAITKIDGRSPSMFEGRIFSEDAGHSPEITIEATIMPVGRGVNVRWYLIDPDDTSSNHSPIDWNDDDGTDSDGVMGDVDGNDNRGRGKLSCNISTTDNSGVARSTLTGTPFGGDNFIVKASLEEGYVNPADSTKVITVWMKRTVEVDEMKGTSASADTLNDYLKDVFYTFKILPSTTIVGEQSRLYVEPDVLSENEDSNKNEILDLNEDDGGKLPPGIRLRPVDDGDGNLENFFAFPPEILIVENVVYAAWSIEKFLQDLDNGTGQIHLVGCRLAHPWLDGGPISWFGLSNAFYGLVPPGSNDVAVFYDLTKGDSTTAHEVSSHILGATHAGPPAEPGHRRKAGHYKSGACLAGSGEFIDTLCDNCIDFIRDNPY